MSIPNDSAASSVTYTFCQICEQMCGLKVTVQDRSITRIEPDKDNPFNWRDFCIKGASASMLLNHPARLTSPMKRVGTGYVSVSYEQAVDEIAERLADLIDQHGPNTIGTYLGNPSAFNLSGTAFLTMLLDGIGTKNRYSVGSIDQNAYHVVMEELYGNEWAALQPDIDRSDYFLLIGTNPAISGMNWLGRVPDGWKRILKAVANGATLTVVDPRRTESAAKATHHVAPLPGTDWAFLLVMIATIVREGLAHPLPENRVSGLEQIFVLTQDVDCESLSSHCDVPLDVIRSVAREFAQAPNAMAIARTGVSMTSTGTMAIWLTALLNILTSRLQAPGGLFYPQSTLDLVSAAEAMFPAAKLSSPVRGLPAIGGYFALAELPDAILTEGPDKVRGIIIFSGNPVISGPDGAKLLEALKQLELTIAVDLFQRDSHQFADWIIPAVHFLERTSVNPFVHALNPVPFVQAGRAVVSPPEGVLPEWQFFQRLMIALEEKLGRPCGYQGHEVTPDAISGHLLSLGGQFEMDEVLAAPHGVLGPKSNEEIATDASFAWVTTADKKIAAAPSIFLGTIRNLMDALGAGSGKAFRLISRRRLHSFNSWMTESSVTRMPLREGDKVEINTQDAAELGIADGDKVIVRSSTASVEAIASVSDAPRPGVVVMEQGWGTRTYNPKTGEHTENGGVNRNRLISNADLDPLSGVPKLNGTAVEILRTNI